MAKNKNTPPEASPKPTPSIFGVPSTDLPGESLVSGGRMGVEELIEKIREMEDYDIFTDVGDALLKLGDRVTYTIFKDGEVVSGAVKPPFSWDQVHKKWGGGVFKVLCRCASANGYVKGQVLNLAPIEIEEEEEDDEPDSVSTSGHSTDLVALLQTMKDSERQESRAREERMDQQRRDEQDRRDREMRERAEESKKANSDTMQMLMQMMKSSSDQTTALLAGLMGNKKDDIKVERLMEMADARAEKIIDRLTGPKGKGELGVAEQVKLLSDAEDRGYKRAMQSIEMAEKKAEQIADMREAGGPSDPAKQSTTEKLIEAAMPMVQMFAAQKLPGLLGPTAAPPAPPAAPVPGKAAAQPRLPAPGPQPSVRPQGPRPGAPLPPPRNQPLSPQQRLTMARAKIEEVVIGEITKDLQANMFTQKFVPEETANKVLNALAPVKIGPDMLCSQYSLDDMLRLAAAKGLPDALKPYFERFYVHIKSYVPVKPPVSAAPIATKQTEPAVTEPRNASVQDKTGVDSQPSAGQPAGSGSAGR